MGDRCGAVTRLTTIKVVWNFKSVHGVAVNISMEFTTTAGRN